MMYNGRNQVKIVKYLPSGKVEKDYKIMYFDNDLLNFKETRYKLILGNSSYNDEIFNLITNVGITDEISVNYNI